MKLFNILFWTIFILIVILVISIIFKKYTTKKHNDSFLQKIEKKLTTSNIKEPKNESKDVNLNLQKNNLKNTNLYERLSLLNANLQDEIFIRIFKKEYLLEVWIKPKDSKTFKLLKEYEICKYSGDLGPKLKEGDYQAPEGFYKVYKSSLNPYSNYHLAFNLGFPNSYDKAHKRTGSYLMVHGKCASTGCYAMGDSNIEEIYLLVSSALKNKQKYVQVHIFPFKMNNLKEYKNHKWYNFWQNLKEGYDIFEKNKIPPNVSVKNKRYSFD
jgi:murein L,D-transpeptidase YafK